jgi:hypothetical protein
MADRTENPMITLRIEHAIHDYDQWKAAFDSFAAVRVNAGVRGHAIRRPVEDRDYLMLDLEFDTADAAGHFIEFLEQRVWSSPKSAPALAGVPRTRLLELQATDGQSAVPGVTEASAR